jgi:tetratricopeptide (TPR) repeat protein
LRPDRPSRPTIGYTMKFKSSFALTRSIGSLAFAFVLASLAGAQTRPPDRQLQQGPTPQSQNSAKRLALVIGNGAYQYAGKLTNPANDATLVATTLRQIGFEVKNGSNLTQREMKQRIREFGLTLRASGGVGLFYFAGHGVQAKGHNYLVPVDADIQTEADLEDVAVDLNYVLSLMDDAQNALNIVVLDACRNNPFARSFRSSQDGLTQVKAPTGTLIAYATAPDSVAADGKGANSPYTEELIRQMQASGILVETVFRRVTEQVSVRTRGKQEPWFSANVKGDFYFIDGSEKSGPAGKLAKPEPNSKVDPLAIELSYWDAIKNSTDPADYNSYLAKYPNGQFADLARRRASSSAKTGASPNAPASLDRYVKSGDDFTAQGKWADAAAAYALAIELDRMNVELHNKLGYALHGNRKYAQAESEYRTALLISGDNAEAHYGMGRALREQKRVTEAEAEARRAVQLKPEIAKYHAALGNTLGAYQKKWAEGEAETREAIRLEPTSAAWRHSLGQLFAKQKKWTEAETEFREAVRMEPNSAPYRVDLSWTLRAQNKFTEAETAAREAVRLAPNSFSSHSELGADLHFLSKETEAETEIRESLRINADSHFAHYILGLILEKLNRNQEAKEQYREAVRLNVRDILDDQEFERITKLLN